MTSMPAFGKADLSKGDRESIQIPGSIQFHGALLVLDPDALTILQVAGDTARLLGMPRTRCWAAPPWICSGQRA